MLSEPVVLPAVPLLVHIFSELSQIGISALVCPRATAAGICTPKALRSQSVAEQYAYRSFLQQLGSHAVAVAPTASAQDAAAMAYGAAVLGIMDVRLGRALVAATAPQLRSDVAALAAAAGEAPAGEGDAVLRDEAPPPPPPRMRRRQEQQDMRQRAAAAALAALQLPPSQAPQLQLACDAPALASLMWGLGSGGVVPPAAWLEDLTTVAGKQLHR